MRHWLGRLLLAGAMLTLAASSVGAACAPEDLAGRWDSYTFGDADGEAFWERCRLSFDAGGAILSGSFCRTDTDERSTISGQLDLAESCRLTGTLTQQFPGEDPNSCEIPQATLSKSVETLTGVGRCGDAASIFSFTMIRR